jgi:peptidoglycan/LPS O-acetylase OafA/YrhL
MKTTSATPIRRYDLDWLRVLMIVFVFVFHASRFFDTEFWHVKNATTYEGVDIWIAALGNWLMPMIFIVSGASMFLALDRGRANRRPSGTRSGFFLVFAKDKALRLGVPLIVGIFTHVMLQVYLEKITHQEFFGTFWEFIPTYFKGWYGFGGNFAWMGLHLWYLLMLLVFALALYLLLVWLCGPARMALDALTRFLSLPGAMYLLAAPTILAVVLLDPQSLLGRRVWGGWSLAAHAWFFIAGFVVLSSEPLQARIKQWRWVSSGLGVLIMAGLVAFNQARGDPLFGTTDWAIFWGLLGLCSWTWIMVWLGHGMQGLNFSTPFLRYANEAVLPFYVMHQSVLLVVGYFVVRWPVSDLAKFLIIGVGSLAIILGFYEFAIRRVNVLRFLFGMRPLSAKAPVPSTTAAPKPTASA